MFLHGQFGVGVQMAVQLVHPHSLLVGEFQIPQWTANHVLPFFDGVFLLVHRSFSRRPPASTGAVCSA
jgi:hypothetical protein